MAGRTLYELTGEWLKFYDLADDPDMDDDSWFQMMGAIEGDIEDKAENIGRLVAQLNGEADAFKAESQRLAKKQKAIENRVKWLKANLESAMRATGKTKFETEHFKFGIQKNGGKPSLVLREGLTTSDVDGEYLTFPEPVFNNDAIRNALDAGVELSWATLVQGESLRIR